MYPASPACTGKATRPRTSSRAGSSVSSSRRGRSNSGSSGGRGRWPSPCVTSSPTRATCRLTCGWRSTASASSGGWSQAGRVQPTLPATSNCTGAGAGVARRGHRRSPGARLGARRGADPRPRVLPSQRVRARWRGSALPALECAGHPSRALTAAAAGWARTPLLHRAELPGDLDEDAGAEAGGTLRRATRRRRRTASCRRCRGAPTASRRRSGRGTAPRSSPRRRGRRGSRCRRHPNRAACGTCARVAGARPSRRSPRRCARRGP